MGSFPGMFTNPWELTQTDVKTSRRCLSNHQGDAVELQIDFKELEQNMNNLPKQVIVLRKDLNMRKGKMVAQGSHASMGAILKRGIFTPEDQFVISPDIEMAEWLLGRFTKICVSCPDESALLDIYQKALDAGLNCSLIQDAGLTEFGGVPTYTAVAVGPNYPDRVDPITGGLPLL